MVAAPGAVIAQAGGGEVARAEQLMREGKPAEAYALLEPVESANAGDVRFDYTFGVVALDAGHPDRATIAFERVLAMDPNYAGARLDLARAYFSMGSDDLAQSEFDTVLQSDPPAEVRQIIDRYKEAIAERKKRADTHFTGYVEANGGYDSNISAVNSSFAAGVLQAYNIANVQPSGNSIKRNGYFNGYALGGDYARPFDAEPALSWYAGGDVRDRHYANDNHDNKDAFDSQQFDLRGGLAYAFEHDLLKAGVQQQQYFQEGAAPLGPNGTRISNDRKTFGYALEWRHTLAPGRQLAAFTQINEQRFATNNIQDINQNMYGLQFLNAFQADWNPLVFVMGFQSRDHALRPQNAASSADVSKTLTGVRVYGQITPREDWDVYASLGHTERKDNSMFSRSIIIDIGRDRSFDSTLGVNWRFKPNWLLRTQVTNTENRSNITLYNYARTEVNMAVRYEFR
jgi:tetratricopeptide (TPR) repeat protein